MPNTCDVRISLDANIGVNEIVAKLKEVRKEFPTAQAVVYDKTEHVIVAYGVEIHDALKETHVFA